MALDLPNVAHMAHLSRRSAVRALNEPAVMLPTTVFPLIFFAVLAGGVSAARGIPGFPSVPSSTGSAGWRTRACSWS